ncbi:hypothetical protein BG011_004564 [Mortierella polycephala]|uniref:Uncharacterized protein n=1 Tax=Mortierella polycephala TaxID=41804 RepID=A0A9P6QDN3_9FUNG|nr:hypothetical protein BG011_004564 [Mortierella polycephala]
MSGPNRNGSKMGRSGAARAGAGAGAPSTRTGPVSSDPPITTAPNAENHSQNQDQDQGQDQDQDQNRSMVTNIETATHIVVEHHRSGTVQTHIFASKDGQPSMKGHTIPDTANMEDAFESVVKNNTQTVLDSIQNSKDESHDDALALTNTIIENASHASEVTAAMIENHIRTDVVPHLDKIEKLLLLQTQSVIGSSPDSLSHIDLSTIAETLDPGASVRSAVGLEAVGSPQGNRTDPDAASNGILDKLTAVEGQVDAMYKYIIEGQLPLDLTVEDLSRGIDPNRAPGASSDVNEATTTNDPNRADDEAMARFNAMRDEMLNFPNLTQYQLEAMSEHQEADAEVEPRMNDISTGSENAGQQQWLREEEKWRTILAEMMAKQGEDIGNLDTKYMATDSEFKQMQFDFKDWRKTHQQSLAVYLKYMYHVFKRTANVDDRIHEVLTNVNERSAFDEEQRQRFSADLASMRADIVAVLTSLPEALLSAMKQSEERVPETPAPQDTPTSAAGGGDAASLQPTGARPLHGPGSRRLGEPLPVPAEDSDNNPSQEDTDPPAPSSPIQPEQPMEKLVQTMETLQASIASMTEKYGELMASVAPLPPTPAPVPLSGDKPEDSAPTQESPDSDQFKTIVDHLENITKMIAPAPDTAPDTAPAPESSIAPTIPPAFPAPAPGYGPLSNMATTLNAREFPSTPGSVQAGQPSATAGSTREQQPTGAGPIPGPDFFQELQLISRNLGDFVNFVTTTTARLDEGHTFLHHAILSGFQRVLDTINPSKSEAEEAKESKELADEEEEAKKKEEERVLALERISMLPQMTESLEGMNYHYTGRLNEVIREVQEIRNANLALHSNMESCHIDVRNVLQGCIQDSSVLAGINGHAEMLVNSQRDVMAQLTEVSKTAADMNAQATEINGATKDAKSVADEIKASSEKTLIHQEAFETKVVTWHQRHDETWKTWQEKHAATATNLHSWHDKHDQDLRDLDDWRIQHDSELILWHKAHDERLQKLESRQFHCCIPSVSGAGEPGLTATESCSRLHEARALPNDSGDIATNEDDPIRQRGQVLFDQLLRAIMPKDNERCITCGNLFVSEGAASVRTPGDSDTEPPLPEVPVTEDETRSVGAAPTYQEFYELLRAHFLGEGGEHGSAPSASVSPAVFDMVKRELMEFQIKYAELQQSSQDELGKAEYLLGRTSQDLNAVRSEKARLEQEYEMQTRLMVQDFENQRTRLEEELTQEKAKVARKTQKLKDANTSFIRQLYGESLGMDPAATRDPAADNDNDIESGEALVIPRYSLMNEAAQDLRETLNEFKAQQAELQHGIRELQEKKASILEDIAKTEGGCSCLMPKADDEQRSKGMARAGGSVETDISQAEGPQNVVTEDENMYTNADNDRVGGDRSPLRPSSWRNSRGPNRQQRRKSRGVSVAPSKSRSRRGDEKLPHLETEILLVENGVAKRTLFQNSTILTETEFEKICEQSSGNDPKEADNVWSLNCDFKVQMKTRKDV